ncbi:protein FAM47E-like [Eublepharis macularius]|uniref:Protein FAM47E-like n=1 Tax=Eublepharis macularius TaxID=481883 RepID=A0AA97JY18_EUBMA|nr:protein FAM47E-like [Eublepharis macularius]
MSPAPWYKARLPSKCFQEYSCKKERYSDALNSQRWRFLKSGLDDFRNGCCPPADNIIIRGNKGPVPIILRYKKPDPSQIVPCKPWELRTKSDISFSKLSTSQKAKKEYIAQTERCLAEHPLALYPHLEESVPPELFCDVVKLLDPEMHRSRILQNRPQPKTTLPTFQYQVQSHGLKPGMRHSSATEFWKPKYKNPYMWLSKKEVAAREEADRIGYVPPLDENVKQITKDFCDWVNTMGGEQYNIDEATLMKLFDTRYETKAASSAPIKIVKLYQVPAELKECLGRPPSPSAYKSSLKTSSEPKQEKIKYGAWYLHPKTWKKLKVEEKPAVPDILQNFLNLRKYGKKVEKIEEEAKPLHGIYAFDEFLELKGYRKPASHPEGHNARAFPRDADGLPAGAGAARARLLPRRAGAWLAREGLIRLRRGRAAWQRLVSALGRLDASALRRASE